MKLNIIIQARCSSSRLPYKSLMPVGGYPLILLIAKRLRHKDFNIVVATSNHKSDDDLCKLLEVNNIKYFRGDLNNVYKRICDCVKSLKNNYLTLRLTGDNPFIDFRIVKKIVNELIIKKKNYNYIDNNISNVPYGISVEVFDQKFLKNLKPKNNFEKEHVTISARNEKNNKYKSDIVFFKKDYSKLSCSIDTLDNYILINLIFAKVSNPLKQDWSDLCKHLKNYQKKDTLHLPLNEKIILGTAQLGDKYGINNFYKINKKKIESFKERKKIINYALKLGITKLDTARKYKNSEKIIGSNFTKKALKIHTKIMNINSRNKDIINMIKKSVNRSIKNLKHNKIELLYFHNHENSFYLNAKDFDLIKKLISCKYFGVSIYDTKVLQNLIRNKNLDVFQVPFNIFDSKFKNFFKILKKNNKKIVVRSIFLQGLIFSSKWPLNIEIHKKLIINKLNYLIDKFKRVNMIDLCVAYVNYHKQIDGIIIGIDNKSQLFQVFSFLKNKPLKTNQVKEIDKFFKKIPEIVYDVRSWKI